MHRSHVRHRRNDTSRLVREIKRRLHARSRPISLCPLPFPSSSLLSLSLSFTPFSPSACCGVFTSTTQSRGSPSFVSRGKHGGEDMFYAIGGHYRISSCPPLSLLTIAALVLSRIARARRIPADTCLGKIPGATAYLLTETK